MRSVQGRGLPGCSSHRNGTEAVVVWSGGVEVPEGEEVWWGGSMEKSGSLGVEYRSGSVSDSEDIVCVSFSL
ncbi:hypothetical protein Hanom_Chr16g01437281 [Helianthus anomalus]